MHVSPKTLETQLAGAVEYTDCILIGKGVRLLHPTSVLDMTLNNLIVRYQ